MRPVCQGIGFFECLCNAGCHAGWVTKSELLLRTIQEVSLLVPGTPAVMSEKKQANYTEPEKRKKPACLIHVLVPIAK